MSTDLWVGYEQYAWIAANAFLKDFRRGGRGRVFLVVDGHWSRCEDANGAGHFQSLPHNSCYV